LLTNAKFLHDVICNRICVDIFYPLSTMHECDRRTEHGTVTSIAIGEITYQRCHLIITAMSLSIKRTILSVKLQGQL